MIILLIIAAIGLMFLGMYFWDKDWEALGAALMTIAVFMLIAGVIASVVLVDKCVESKYIDSRIAMYQEENDNIEKDITVIVKQYQEHETEVFDMSEVESPTTLVQMYPELKSNELVVKQIEVFNNNNKKIKQLKSKKIDCEKAKFLLYFGGK